MIYIVIFRCLFLNTNVLFKNTCTLAISTSENLWMCYVWRHFLFLHLEYKIQQKKKTPNSPFIQNLRIWPQDHISWLWAPPTSPNTRPNDLFWLLGIWKESISVKTTALTAMGDYNNNDTISRLNRGKNDVGLLLDTTFKGIQWGPNPNKYNHSIKYLKQNLDVHILVTMHYW